MPFQHPEEIGYGYVIERYAARKDSGYARYLVLKSGRFLRPEWPHAEQFVRRLIDDSATITDGELEALLGYEWRSRLTAAWLIGVGRRATFRERIGGLLLVDEFCFSGGAYCFALARFGTHHADRFTSLTVSGTTGSTPWPTSTTTPPTPPSSVAAGRSQHAADSVQNTKAARPAPPQVGRPFAGRLRR
ncbi:DUF6000 family protein [Streptomyces albogriseolus]